MGDKGSEYFYDIYKSWVVVLIAAVGSVVVAYLYLFVMRLLGGVIVWVSFILTLGILIAGGFYAYFKERPKYSVEDPTYNYIAYGAYVCWALAGIVCFALCCCFNAI